MSKDLEIIILNYNAQFWLKKTLSTLKEQYLDKTKYTVEVTVVDNASQDDSVKMLKKDFPWVKVLESGGNIGFAAGNNLALKETKSRYVMLLNSDVESTKDSHFDEVIEYLDEHTQVAVITPLILLANGMIDWACHRGEPDIWASFTYFTGLEKHFKGNKRFGQYHQTYKDLRSIHEIDACSGAAMIVRTSAMKEVGYLDETFFMYAEDLDWCKRFKDAGYQIVFYPNVTVIHHKYKSGISSISRETAAKTRNYFYETMLQYYDKHYQNRYPTWVRWLVQQVVELKKGAV